MMTPEMPRRWASATEITRLTTTATVAYSVTALARPMPISMVLAIVAELATSWYTRNSWVGPLIDA